MIYTIGHKENYLKAIAEHGEIYKCAGGYAFKTIEDAQAEIEHKNQVGSWAIWSMNADYETDTEFNEKVGTNLLTKDAVIIGLVE